MPSIWKGHITFGLVSFPVRLHAAARSLAVSFNQLHQCDHSRVRQVLYCQAENMPSRAFPTVTCNVRARASRRVDVSNNGQQRIAFSSPPPRFAQEIACVF
jgi:hypothetical protein